MPPLLGVTKEFKREALGVHAEPDSRQKVPDALIVGPPQLKSDTLASVEFKSPVQKTAKPARHAQYVALRDGNLAPPRRIVRRSPNNSVCTTVFLLQELDADSFSEAF